MFVQNNHKTIYCCPKSKDETLQHTVSMLLHHDAREEVFDVKIHLCIACYKDHFDAESFIIPPNFIVNPPATTHGYFMINMGLF